MPVDPRYFENFGPLPDKGQLISCLLRNGEVLMGRVTLVWLCLDTPCINVQTASGRVRHAYPDLGDRWWAETDPDAVALWASISSL